MTSEPLISIYPSQHRAELARRSFYFQMLSSLGYLVSISSKKSNDINISSLIRNPKSATALNPRLFYLHDMLLRYLREQDIKEVNKILNSLNTFIEETINDRQPNDLSIQSVGFTDWERFITTNSIESSVHFFGKKAIIEPVTDNELAKNIAFIKSAIELIAEYFSPMNQELTVFLNTIRIFQGAITMGITDVRMFGCMFIRTPREGVASHLYYGEHLVHEISHMYLNAAMSLDPIVLNDRSELFVSPIRPDPRPMIGVFHATFVTSRIVQLFASLVKAKYSDEAKIYLYQQLDELKAGVSEIKKGAKLTSSGISLLKEFEVLIGEVEALSEWHNFNPADAYQHRFGGGFAFKPARERVMEHR